MIIKFPLPRILLPFALLFSLVIMSGCGSDLTNLDLPSSVPLGGNVQAVVTHAWDDTGFDFETTDESSLIFSAVVPSSWTPLPGGNYQGTFDSIPFSRAANIIADPPDSNLLDLLVDEGDITPEEEALAELFFCDLTFPEVPTGFQLLWYQTAGQLPEDVVVLGDAGTLTINYTVGDFAGNAQVTYQHAVYLEGMGSVDDEDPDVFITACTWLIDEATLDDEIVLPESITGFVALLGEAITVPALGGFALIFLSLILAITGRIVGRRGAK